MWCSKSCLDGHAIDQNLKSKVSDMLLYTPPQTLFQQVREEPKAAPTFSFSTNRAARRPPLTKLIRDGLDISLTPPFSFFLNFLSNNPSSISQVT